MKINLKGTEMAISKQKEQDIILLRAEGYSLDKIKEKVKVSKPTILKVVKENELKISDLRNKIDKEFIQDYKALRIKRAKGIISALEKAYEAMDKTVYEDLSKKELIYFISTMEGKLQNLRTSMKEDVVENY